MIHRKRFTVKSIAIIPARSGSKGLKDKNIRELAGKPLIAWTIEAAKESSVFDEIMVSTDSEQYAGIARAYGASVPFLRSAETSSDTASSWDAVKEALEGYRQAGREFDAFCLLQPTSPLRTAEDIREAYTLLQKVPTAVISVCEAEHSPRWCNTLPADGSLDGFIPRADNTRRQAAGKYYRVNGAIYFVRTAELYKDPHFYRAGSFAYVMDRRRSIDIDDAEDFETAEFLMERKEKI